MQRNKKSRNKAKSKSKASAGSPEAPLRLQKLIAQAGIASRRAAERLIAEGRVTVDGRVVDEPGTKVDPARARVEVNGRPVTLDQRLVYALVHKPKGTVCTAQDPEGRERVLDLLKERLPRVWTVGRLDLQTSGAILVTNDGELTAALLRTSNRVERFYDVKLREELSAKQILAITEGVRLEDGSRSEGTAPTLLQGEAHAWWYRLVLHEGRNREVRQMFTTIHALVQKLHRTMFAGLTLEGVRPGRYRYLDAEEVRTLYELVGLPWSASKAVWAPRRLPEPRQSASRDKRGGKSGRGDSGAGNRNRR